MSKDRTPNSCPCLGHKKFDCSRHGRIRGSEGCFGEQYQNCPAFSAWFWFTAAQQARREIMKRLDVAPPKIVLQTDHIEASIKKEKGVN